MPDHLFEHSDRILDLFENYPKFVYEQRCCQGIIFNAVNIYNVELCDRFVQWDKYIVGIYLEATPSLLFGAQMNAPLAIPETIPFGITYDHPIPNAAVVATQMIPTDRTTLWGLANQLPDWVEPLQLITTAGGFTYLRKRDVKLGLHQILMGGKRIWFNCTGLFLTNGLQGGNYEVQCTIVYWYGKFKPEGMKS